MLLSVLAISTVFTSCKKEEIDETVLDGRTINYSVLVTSGASSTNKAIAGMDGASVTVSVNGASTTVTSDANGHANFTNLASGSAAVTVSKSGFTTLNYIVDLTPSSGASSDYDATEVRNSSTLVTIFPTSGAGTATIKGRARAELDWTNATSENAPAGTKIIASILTDLSSYNVHYGDGEILSQTYEGIVVSTTVDSNGDYTLIVPASGGGLSVGVQADDFEYNTITSATTTSRNIYSTGQSNFSVVSGQIIFDDINY